MTEKYYSISPYVYCMNNPVKYMDPDGKEIRALTADAQRMIMNTLPKELRQHISFDSNGYVNTAPLEGINSKSENFNSFRTMAMSELTMEVIVSNTFDYANKKGEINTRTMTYLGVDKDFIGNDSGKGIGVSTGETGFLGKTLFPDLDGQENFPNNNIIVVVNSNLSEEGRAQTYAHEANGHSYIYITTGNRNAASHQYERGGTDTNRALFNTINETINNMK